MENQQITRSFENKEDIELRQWCLERAIQLELDAPECLALTKAYFDWVKYAYLPKKINK